MNKMLSNLGYYLMELVL